MEPIPKPPQRPAGIPPSMRQRPSQPRPVAVPSRTTSVSSRSQEKPKNKRSYTLAAIGISVVSVLIITAATVMGITKLMTASEVKNGTDQYQAVFLSNNMVYFGKISNITGEYIKMTDIYYIQVQQQQNDQKTQNTQQPQISLTKLGNELHGPEDAMYINRKEVLFWENLKTDSKVVQAIKNYRSGNK